MKEIYIYLITEDNVAEMEFRNASQLGWNVLSYRPFSEFPPSVIPKHAAKATAGKLGLESIVNLLLILESKYYILTRGSNWSRLIDELRKTRVDGRGRFKTEMIDLTPENDPENPEVDYKW